MPGLACRTYAPVGGHRDLLAYLVRRLLDRCLDRAQRCRQQRLHRPALDLADAHDVQLAVHTDGMNELLSVEDTIAVTAGRTWRRWRG